ncbi:hypothetical protein CFP56_016297, partial [Quercus suber]
KVEGQIITPEVETWVENSLEIDGLLNRGQFAEVSYPPTVGKGSFSMKEALRDDDVNMIVICGMGG